MPRMNTIAPPHLRSSVASPNSVRGPQLLVHGLDVMRTFEKRVQGLGGVDIRLLQRLLHASTCGFAINRMLPRHAPGRSLSARSPPEGI